MCAAVAVPLQSGSSSSNGVVTLPLPISSPSQQAYISELLSFSLERLHKEPELLRVDADRIQRQMQEVAVGHYRAFIAAADAVQHISHEITSVDQHLKSLVAEIPKLTSGCNDFIDEAQQILEKKKLNRTLLANHGTLLDLLEIPQLMDTCVRNANYDEALDLEAFVSKLATMHSRLPIIQSLVADVRQTTEALLAQLLQRLQSNIQLPECLRVIGHLRRLATFSEHEMRLQFLKCREVWLKGIIDDLDQSNPYEYLKRMADCHRVHLFDVVMQYRAIFYDDTSGHEENTDGGLLYSWAVHRISTHLHVLQSVLPRITEGPNLAIILEQCMYCGMSLGRVGLDFRGLLPPIFEGAVHDLFIRNMSVALQNFQLVLDSHRWVPLPPVGLGSRASGRDDFSDDMAPPYSLMEHPPLAVFVNGKIQFPSVKDFKDAKTMEDVCPVHLWCSAGVLAALNELRHCAPISLKGVLASELQQAFQGVANSLLQYNATHILRDSESSLFLALCRAFIEVGCPFLVLCFGRLYPGASSLIQVKDVLEGVQKLVISSSPPLPKDNGNGNNLSESSTLIKGTINQRLLHQKGIGNGAMNGHDDQKNTRSSADQNDHAENTDPQNNNGITDESVHNQTFEHDQQQ